MQTLSLSELWTLLAALLTIGLGTWVSARVPLLARYLIPPAVIGGFLVAVVLLVLQQFDGRIGFASQARGALLLIFFTTLGLTARLAALRGGGSAVALVALAIALPAVGQNPAGAGVAWGFGEPASLAVFLGSAAFLGSVVATRLLHIRGRATAHAVPPAPVDGEMALHTSHDTLHYGTWTSSDRWLRQLPVLADTVALALAWQHWLDGRGINVPPFLACLLAGAIAVTLVRHAAARGAPPALAQREGTIAAGGFMGFGLGTMPVGLSVMWHPSLQHGAAPRAFLVVTLAASLVQDLINAGLVQAALSWAAP